MVTMIERILAWGTAIVLVTGVAFAGHQYKEVHLPAFEVLQKSVEYQQCIQECIETCKANAVPVDTCNCDRCNVHRVY